jgi:DnaJ-class molecular chaperone
MEGLKHTLYIQCPKCHGKRKFEGEECPKCKGTGKLKKLYTGKFDRSKTLL